MKELDSFTVEQLNDFIKSDHAQCGDVAALAAIALAAKRAEPCGYAHKNAIKFDLHDTCRLHEQAGDENFIALYTTPQLNSQVPLGSWIKCSDRMPEDDTLCLGVDECGVIWTMHFDDGEFQPDTGDVDDLKISHWMSLPDAPEKENG